MLKMSTTYILEKLREIKSASERRKEAVRLFGCFSESIPTGGVNPGLWPGDISERTGTGGHHVNPIRRQPPGHRTEIKGLSAE